MGMAGKTEFTQKARKAIHKRDEETCVFCAMGYHMPPDPENWPNGLQVMHIVPRSQLGKGIEQNGALGCIYHHQMMDNGNGGHREEMVGILEGRMRSFYPGWTRESVTFKKYGCQQPKAAAGSRPAAGPGSGFWLIPDGVEGEIPI